MSLANVFAYSEPVWARFAAPEGVGVLDGDTVRHVDVRSPASRARLRLWVRLQAGCIAETRFQALGCPVTLAVGQWLTEVLPGRRIDDLRGDWGAVCRAALEIGDDKAHCWVMADDVVAALGRTAQDE